MPATYPTLYEVNTRVWLTELGRSLGRPAVLDDVPDAELDRFAQMGLGWIWFLSVWQTGLAGQQVSRSRPEWRKEFKETLPDLKEEDIAGSGFAVTGYSVPAGLGGDAALARLRARLQQRGLRLMLDFVPNHTGLDHPWVQTHPEYYVAGSAADLARAPQNYVRVKGPGGELILAHGRDPYFDGWPDSLQLDYSNPATQEAMLGELVKVAGQCDGVRCDMAMLLLPEVFERTWGRRPASFWPRAIARVRAQLPDFRFLAEVYWDLEGTLLEQGFDFAYDKRLYDRLRAGQARPVREHLQAGLDYQDHMARFLENHDEPRAAAVFPAGMHEAAAAITFLAPGLRFFHQGQFEGRRTRIPTHLVRGPDEQVNPVLRRYYDDLLAVLRRPEVREGKWRLLECVPAWEGNGSYDALIAFAWQGGGGERLLVAVNYAAHQSQGYVRLPFPELEGRRWQLEDLLSEARYERDGNDLASRGLYLDVPPWQHHAFALLRE